MTDKIKRAIAVLEVNKLISSSQTEFCESADLAIQALEKQVAKKPSKDEFDRYICPDCGWIVYKDEFGGRYLLHCENCGKKQDWSDEE